MSKPVSITLRVLGVLLVLAAGAALAFRWGYGQGVAQSPVVAEQIQTWQKSDESAAPLNRPGAWGPMMPHFSMPLGHFGFFPFGHFLGFLLLIGLFFGLMRMFFFRRWAHHHPGPWHGPVPPCPPPPQQPSQQQQPPAQ